MNAFDTADPVDLLAAAIRAAWAGVTSRDGVTVVSGDAASALERFYGVFTEHAEASGAVVIAVPAPDGDPLALLAAGVGCDTADAGSRAWAVAMALLDRTVEGRLVVLIVAAAERLNHCLAVRAGGIAPCRDGRRPAAAGRAGRHARGADAARRIGRRASARAEAARGDPVGCAGPVGGTGRRRRLFRRPARDPNTSKRCGARWSPGPGSPSSSARRPMIVAA